MGNDGPGIRSAQTRDRAVAAAWRRAAHARWLALSIQGLGLFAAGLAASRDGFPSAMGVVVVLVATSAACVNRQALFSTEISLTAEASVIVCAVVLFERDAALVAPMIVGLASGWLDSFQWSSRAWIPMAFNSGSRALEALVAALAFTAVTGVFGHAPFMLTVAGVLAAGVFTLADVLIFGVLLMVRDGARPRAAAHDASAFAVLRASLATYGAAAGLVGIASLPLLGAVAAVPAAWIPEAVLVRPPQVVWRRLARWAVVAAIAVSVAVGVGLFVGLPTLPATAALLALGLVAGLELGVDRRVLVPPALGAVVLLAVGATERSSSPLAAGLVAITALSVSWSLGSGNAFRRFALAGSCTIAVAVGTGLVAGSGASSLVVTATFLLGAVVVTPHRAGAVVVAWTVPLVIAGATAGELRAWIGSTATLFVGGVALVLGVLVIAWAGPPPWRSRFATRWTRLRVPGSHRRLWAAFGAVVVAVAATAGLAPAHSATAAVSVVVLALVTETAATVALDRVRLWRFRRPRRYWEMMLLATGLVAAWWSANLAPTQPRLALASGAAASVGVLVIGWSNVGLADRAEAPRSAANVGTGEEVGQ